MSKVSIRVNDRAFSIGCEPGQEAHVQKLGDAFDQTVCDLAKQVGQIGDLRLFLMAALVLSDELEGFKTGKNSAKSTSKSADIAQVEQDAAKALHTAADQVERIAAKFD